ncbi:MAG: hypothetical protein WDA00_04535 [Eubacteriales bacterium]
MHRKHLCFADEAEKKAFVLACEADFEDRIDQAIATVMQAPELRLLTVSGPTCSGKTTMANKLIREFEERGKKVHVISLDDFYHEREFLVSRAAARGEALDLDSEDTIDLPTLAAAIEAIFEGNQVTLPVFDFTKGSRTGETVLHLDERDVFIFEGIQAVYPSVTQLFGTHPVASVFIWVGEDLEQNGQVFPKHEVRFFRRLVRDHLFRSATPEFTFKIWESVRRNEERLILPFSDKCTVTLSSLMPYEMAMLKPYLMPLLSAIEPNSPFFEEAERMRSKLMELPEISAAYLPQISVYHEFLG